MTATDSGRRLSPRVKCRWTVKCITEQKKTFDTRAINISKGGIQVGSPVPFKNGDRLYMEINGYHAGVTQVIKVVGEVVYFSVSAADDMQIGLQFISNMPIEDSKFILSFVKSMMSS